MNDPDVVVLDTLTGPDTLDSIQRTLEESWVRHSAVPEPIRIRLGIAAAEIAANIIEHAGRGRPVRIRMELRVFPSEVQIAFTDDGDPAVVDLTNVALPDDMAERGRGLALAHTVLAKLAYHRNHVGNHWLLVSEGF